MQFKRGAQERRSTNYDPQREDTMSTDSNSPGAQDTRSPFSFSRHQGGGEAPPRGQAEGEVVGAAAHASVVESIVDSGAVVEGHFQADNDLRIQGTISGEITCRGILTIERTATAKARINTQECEVHGTVDGDLTCSGRLRLAATAVVNATIRAGSLVVEEGASIIGSVETNYSGEVTSAASTRRRSRKDDDGGDDRAVDEDAPTTRKAASGGRASRDAPSFALVSSDDSVSEDRESRSS